MVPCLLLWYWQLRSTSQAHPRCTQCRQQLAGGEPELSAGLLLQPRSCTWVSWQGQDSPTSKERLKRVKKKFLQLSPFTETIHEGLSAIWPLTHWWVNVSGKVIGFTGAGSFLFRHGGSSFLWWNVQYIAFHSISVTILNGIAEDYSVWWYTPDCLKLAGEVMDENYFPPFFQKERWKEHKTELPSMSKSNWVMLLFSALPIWDIPSICCSFAYIGTMQHGLFRWRSRD